MAAGAAELLFPSNFVEVHGARMHYVELGSGDPVLFLHGNPTSSYLWRNILPYAARVGRAIAVDLIGMGRSDKPELDYRFFDHVRYVEGFIDRMNLRNLTLVVHDWGSALGFHYARRNEANVRGLVFLEAILAPVPSWDDFPAEFRDLFRVFRTPEVGWELIVHRNVFIEQVLPGGVVRKLTEAEMESYRAPFRDPAHRKPLWRWPNEIPIAGEPADVAEAVAEYHRWLSRTDLPKLLFCATPGAILRAPQVDWCRRHLKKLQIVELGEGLHFLQEDHPHSIGEALANWLRQLP